MGKREKLQEISGNRNEKEHGNENGKWKRKCNILENFEKFSENRNGSEQVRFVELQLAENFLRKQ